MKVIIQHLLSSSLALILLTFAGCRETNSYDVAIYDDETLNRGDTVYLDNAPVATIEDIYRIGDGPLVAKIRVTDKRFEELFIKGIQRKPTRSEIYLESPNIAEGAEGTTLMTGSRIPIRSVPLPPALWPPNQNTIIALSIFLVMLIVVFFIFRTIIKATWTIVALGAAILGAYLTYPFAVPYAQQAIDYTAAHVGAQYGEDPDPIEAALDKVGVFVQREDIHPAHLAFAVLVITYLVVISVILGFAKKRLGND